MIRDGDPIIPSTDSLDEGCRMHDKCYGDADDDPRKENQCDDALREHARNLPPWAGDWKDPPRSLSGKMYGTALRCVFNPVFYIQPLLRGDGTRSNPPSWLH